jgi:hypothetical protein
MTTRFEGYSKYFVKAPVIDEALEAKRTSLLKGKNPTFPLHLTLFTVFVNTDPRYSDGFEDEKVASAFKTSCAMPPSINVKNARYDILGNEPKFFVISFELDESSDRQEIDVKSKACNFWCEALDFSCESEIVNDVYEYSTLKDAEGTSAIKIPAGSEDAKSLHFSLFSSSDLKRYNKSLFKAYKRSEDKLRFVSDAFGDISELKCINFGSELIVSK